MEALRPVVMRMAVATELADPVIVAGGWSARGWADVTGTAPCNGAPT